MESDELRAAFKTRFWRQLLGGAAGAILAVSLVGVGGAGLEEGAGPSASMIVGLVVLAATLGFSFWNWRCPACRRYLGKQIFPKHCSKCGVQFRG